MAYIFYFDVAALYIVITVSIHFFCKKTVASWQTRVFATLIVASMLSSSIDIVTVFTISFPGCVPVWAHYLINIIYLICFSSVPAIYFAYISVVTDKNKLFKYSDRLCFEIPLVVNVLLVGTTPFTKFILDIGDKGEYGHGPLFHLMYGFAVYYIGFALIKTIRYAKLLTRSQKVCVTFYTIASVLALAAQMLLPKLLIIEFVASAAILLIYLSMENPQDYMDKKFGTYNSLALDQVFRLLVADKKPFRILAINIEGTKFIYEKLGMYSGDVIMKDIADYLTKNAKGMKVYFLSGTTFAVSGSDSMGAWDDLIEAIKTKFSNPFYIDELDISLKVNMCLMRYPDAITSIEDVNSLIDYSFTEGRNLSDDCIIYADKDLLKNGKRENQIIAILHQAIRDSAFDVFYQPIYSVEKDRITTAEALVRLKNDELGYISPEEFIPIAERNGLILDIGNVVFNKVCAFYKEKNLGDKGIEYIHVNLSVVECMQDRLYEKLIAIIDSYNLAHECISLEITETAAVVSKSTLRHNMEKLIEAGCRFAMDDYGTGFSNTSTLTRYPFAEIKIDKSMLWGAMEDKKAFIALKHSIKMIKELQMAIVVEGVETAEQAELLKELGCDFFQGYYYSKPIAEEAFLERISQ